jgi:hypothetical protein
LLNKVGQCRRRVSGILELLVDTALLILPGDGIATQRDDD